jgi:hypothetical protein
MLCCHVLWTASTASASAVADGESARELLGSSRYARGGPVVYGRANSGAACASVGTSEVFTAVAAARTTTTMVGADGAVAAETLTEHPLMQVHE